VTWEGFVILATILASHLDIVRRVRRLEEHRDRTREDVEGLRQALVALSESGGR